MFPESSRALSAVSWKEHDQKCPRFSALAIEEMALIPRYTRPEMGQVWSDENKFAKWLELSLPPRKRA